MLRYYHDSAMRVTKTGAGATGDIMPTLNYYDATTGQMTKTRYTDAASNTADVTYFFNAAAQMTKLTDWTSGSNDLEYAYPPTADLWLDIGQLTTITDYDNNTLTYAYDAVGRVTSVTDYHGATTTYAYPPTADLRHNGGRLTTLVAPDQEDGLPACPAGRGAYHRVCMLCAVYRPTGRAGPFQLIPFCPRVLRSTPGLFWRFGRPLGQAGMPILLTWASPSRPTTPTGPRRRAAPCSSAPSRAANGGPGVPVRLRGAGYRRRNLHPELYA